MQQKTPNAKEKHKEGLKKEANGAQNVYNITYSNEKMVDQWVLEKTIKVTLVSRRGEGLGWGKHIVGGRRGSSVRPKLLSDD